MGEKIFQKWGLQPPFNPCNYLRARFSTESYFNTLSATQQDGQTHSTNCLSICDHFVRLAYGDTTQFVWLWKKLAKQVLYFLYIYTIYSVNTRKRQFSTWKHQKTSSNEPSSKFRVQLHFKISVTEDPPA